MHLASPRAAPAWHWGWLVLLLLLLASARGAEVPVPPLKARVTDLTDTLSAAQRARLEQTLRTFEARKGSQIAVLILPTTGEETIEQYSIRVADAWKLGRKGIDDGVLLLVAKDDRTMRLEIGYGLEGVIPDAIAKRIISEVITPFFKQGDFYGGIEAGIHRIIRLIEGEPLPPPEKRDETWTRFEELLPLALIVVLVGGGLLRLLFGRLMGASIAGGAMALIFWILIGSLLVALLVGLLVFLFTLTGGSSWMGRRGYRGWGGGFGTGGGFGGASDGGFRGGGGGFGGGGASGRW